MSSCPVTKSIFGAKTFSLWKKKLVQSGTKFVLPEFQYFEYCRVILVFLSTFMQDKVLMYFKNTLI